MYYYTCIINPVNKMHPKEIKCLLLNYFSIIGPRESQFDISINKQYQPYCQLVSIELF